jgi:hypothetical protein
MFRKLKIVLTYAGLMALNGASVVSAQSEETAWNDADLLNGRLVMSVPAATEVETLGAENIMGAAPATESATRLRITMAGTEIVVQVRELYAAFPRDPARFFREIVMGGALGSDQPEPAAVQIGTLSAYGNRAGSYRHPSGTHVLANLLVGQPDGTVQHLYIMTWDKPADVLDGAIRTVERMVASLRSGTRRGLAAGGTRQLARLSGSGSVSRSLTMDLPEGYVMAVQQGPDFDVYTINKLAPLDAPGGSLGIYVGAHPSYVYAQDGYRLEALARVATTILGQDSHWLESPPQAAGDGVKWTRRETILPLEDSAGLRLHLFASAPADSEQLQELTRLAETGLRLTSP